MELIKLDPNTFREDDIIEDWQSLVWSERYREAGDFQLVTRDISATEAALPLESYVAIRDSNEVMKVEDHLIEEDDDGVENLTVVGRTIEAPVLENRSSILPGLPPLPPDDWAVTLNPSVHATRAINNGYSPYDGIFGDPADNIPGFLSANSVTSGETPVAYHLEDQYKDAYSALMEILPMGDLGVRNWRAPSWAPGSRLVTEVYRGTDRTMGQSTYNKVIFSIENGSLSRSKVLRTVRNLKTVAYVSAPSHFPGATFTVASEYIPGGANAGLARKVLTVKITETEGWPPPQSPSIVGLCLARGRAELAKYVRGTYVEGEASETVKIGTHYLLGDLVTIATPYLTGSMRVTEYVRTHDERGERGHPTLIAI